MAQDCPGTDTECHHRECNNNQCFMVPASVGTVLVTQVPADCLRAECDGMGGVSQIPDASDAASDGLDCTLDQCDNGMTVHPPVTMPTPCMQNGGHVCGTDTAAGTCVECNDHADCPMVTPVCIGHVCFMPTCMDNLPNGAETGVDCGGPQCPPCNNGGGCVLPADCDSGVCTLGTCVACMQDADCAAAAYCDVATSRCVPDATNGTACDRPEQCTSGACVDAVCCDVACAGLCEACTALRKGGGTDGTCGPISSGMDPDSECASQDPTTCGTMGECDGAGACQLYPMGTACSGAQCDALGTFVGPGACSGMGSCVLPMAVVCIPYACTTAGCLTMCGSDAECAGGNWCSGGACVPPQGNGAPCTASNQCGSGQCVDGVCCNVACTGTCQACTAAKKGSGVDGTCGNIGTGVDPDNECPGASSCNGAGACGSPNGQVCATSSECLSGNCVDGVCCNTACGGLCQACNVAGSVGTCSAIPGGTDPANECAGPINCNGAGACGLLPNGTGCTLGAECTSGSCVDGVCCNTACGGLCQACNLAGSLGTCSNIPAGQDPANECSGVTSCSGAGSCALLANGTACNTSSECQSANCVDGFCCNTACNGSCQACSAAKKGSGANGTCGNIAASTDPDNECAGVTTCNGAGACGAAAVCGNGVIEAGEVCDDGGTANGDGCSSSCACESVRSVATATGLNVAVVDNGYNGTIASMACVNVVVPTVNGCLATITSMTVNLAMNHTWVGDLTIKLVSPSSTVVTLMSLPGLLEGADDGTGSSNESSNLAAAFPITFQGGGPKSAEAMGNTLASSGVVCRDDGACTYDPNSGAATPGFLGTFNGQLPGGTWRMCVGDSAAGDLGTVDSVTLNMSL